MYKNTIFYWQNILLRVINWWIDRTSENWSLRIFLLKFTVINNIFEKKTDLERLYINGKDCFFYETTKS